MKTIEKILLFVFYICFASCNGNMEDKLEEIQKELDTIEQQFQIERATNNAIASKNLKEFFTLAYTYGIIDDPTYFEPDSTETMDDLISDFIDEVIDQNVTFKDTVITAFYKIRFYYDTDTTVILVADPEYRFNHARWKFKISKTTGNMELDLWNRDDPYDYSPLPNFVREEDDTLIININTATMVKIPQLQKLKYYESKANAAGYSCHELDTYILLSFPSTIN